MAVQIQEKLNRLLSDLEDGWLVSHAWLQARGYSRSLVGQYVAKGWLVSPARGVFCRPSSPPSWQGVVFSLQRLHGLPLHVGGRLALTLHGQDHYVRPGAADVTLYGTGTLPPWVNELGLSETFKLVGDKKLGWPASDPTVQIADEQLRAVGLEALPGDRPNCPMLVSVPERAALELLLLVPQDASVAEADAVLQGMAGLRPKLLTSLLSECRSIKVKRLFLALTERHGHQWFPHLDLSHVDLGTGKRALTPGGRLNAKYQITLPEDLDDQLV